MIMRVLWITNIPIAEHREMLGLPLSQSGGWLETAYSIFRGCDAINLGVATIYQGQVLKKEVDGNHTFYLVPSDTNISDYNSNSRVNLNNWESVINDFNPSVIHIWGTEFGHGLCALKVRKNIPSVVYIQGMMSQIFNHADGGISFRDQLKSTTLIDIFRRQTYWDEVKSMEKRAKNEREILQLVDGVIVENKWCADNCTIISKHCKVFNSFLPINPVFSKYNWNPLEIEPYTIFTTAGANPMKGHHILLKALAMVVKEYPETRLIIPGMNFYYESGLKNSLKRRSFPRYLLQIIRKNNLEKNVIFIGTLSPEQMAQNMKQCNVFAMPSAIENHSSSLIEAMMVGAPSVSSYVGGVAEYLENGVNGYLYRYDEPASLAAQIIKLFSNRELAVTLSANARKSTRDVRCHINLIDDFSIAYSTIVNNKSI